MVGDGDKSEKTKAQEKPSLGFTLPFADTAPANPIEVMAAATAAGMALSAQFANVFFGMMQAALESTGRHTVPSAEKPAPAAPPSKAAAQPPVSPVGDAGPPVVEQPAPRRAPAEKPAPAPAKIAAVTAPSSLDAPVAKAKGRKPKDMTASAPVARPVTAPVAKPGTRRVTKAADDLKKISGVGPKLEVLLNGMGIRRYRDVATWTQDDVAHFDRELGLDGRIAKDNWIAQAKALLR